MIGVIRGSFEGLFGAARRGMALLAAAIAVVSMAGAPAEANPRYAAFIMDAHTGEVLFARNADAQRYPASITKVMTLYIVFEELEAGRINQDTRLSVSQNAANQVPSKIGVRPGSTISVRDAIGTLVTRSANDVAVVVAENISGSVTAFAERMTRTARSLGMSNTTFRNPHGLPNSGQVSTARDLATLALAVQRRFPQYYDLFSMRSYTYAGTPIRNHNRLLGQMQGMDGVKTGFIRASGFNLAASLRRDGKHLIGVVMGGRTAATRDAHMREILTNALPRASRGPGRMLVAEAPLPPSRPDGDPSLPVHTRAGAMLVPSTSVPATLVTASATRPTPVPEPQTQVAAAPASHESGSTDSDAATAQRSGNWTIQVGAFATEDLARDMLSRTQAEAADLLEGTSPYTETVDRNGATLWRARFAGFERAEAEAACAALERRSVGCFPAQH